MKIGPYSLEGNVVLAPMAGVTDAAFRRVCLMHGAAYAVGEMAASGAHLLDTALTRSRYACDAREAFPVVQILGADPAEMARAAELACECGAKAVDVNFGCPARVVCGKACGSAVMRTPELAEAILIAVAAASSVPVTVKMRTGWDEHTKTAVRIAQAAQDAGFAAVTVHGRTRAQKFTGAVNRADIAEVVRAVTIPVIANGDVTTPAEALEMMNETGAAAVMIGRGAYGNPWIFERVQALIEGRADPGEPGAGQVKQTLLWHIAALFEDCSEERELAAARTFRKHARWYLARYADEAGADGRKGALEQMMLAQNRAALESATEEFFEDLVR